MLERGVVHGTAVPLKEPAKCRYLPGIAILDALAVAALLAACGGGGGGGGGPVDLEYGTVSGTVRIAGTQTPIPGAAVRIGNRTVTSGASGSYVVEELLVGQAGVEATAAGYDTHTGSVVVEAGVNTLDIGLTPRTLYEWGDFVAYVPSDVVAFRGVILFLPGVGGDSRHLVLGEQPTICQDWCLTWPDYRTRAVALARTYGLAVLGTASLSDGPDSYAAITAALSDLSVLSGRPALAQLPLLLFGHSAGGCLAYGFTRMNAARVIGFLSGKGACHTPLEAGVLGALEVPAYFFIGENDLPNRVQNITAVFEQNRALGAPWALAVEPGAGHGTLPDAGLQMGWVEAVLTQRLPATAGSALRPIAPETGWLGNRTTFEIAPWSDYPEPKLEASWLPSAATAAAWKNFVIPGETS